MVEQNEIKTPEQTRALKHPYELSNDKNPYFREYRGANADSSIRNELPLLQNFADSWEPLDTSKTFYKPTMHFTKYDDESPLFTKAGFLETLSLPSDWLAFVVISLVDFYL